MTQDGPSNFQQPLVVFLDGGRDLAVRLRELAFGALLLTGDQVSPADLADWAGVEQALVDDALLVLARQGRIDRAPSGNVVGSAGLTIGSGPHALLVGSRAFRTWCAYDAIGIPAALSQDAVVDTTCGICGVPIQVVIESGRAVDGTAAQLWISDGGRDMRLDFCTPTVLLCSDDHGREWAERQHGRGRLLGVAEGAALGANSWASCASAYAELREALPRGSAGEKLG